MSGDLSQALPRNIFLIGYRATGKTTVARVVAERLAWDWADADDVIAQRAGQSIRQIFASEGEAGFRLREADVLADLCQRERHVIATGGGVILADSNRRLLRSSGLVVWLQADTSTVWGRLRQDATTAERRPDLTIGGKAEVEQLLRAREPLYRETASLHVDTVDRTPDEVAALIVAHWQKSVGEVQRKEP